MLHLQAHRYSANLAGLSLSAIMLLHSQWGGQAVSHSGSPAVTSTPDDLSTSSSNTGNASRVLHEISTAPIISKIESYRALRAGWDGDNSRTIDENTIMAAVSFVRSLVIASSMPNVTVAGDGEISLSWRSRDRFIDVSFFEGVGIAFSEIGGEKYKTRSVVTFADLPALAIASIKEA